MKEDVVLSDEVINKNIIFFDGICNLCNGFVQFVIKRSMPGTFYFASLQGENSKKILGLTSDNHFSTILYLENGILYNRSTAALRIVRKLNFPWNTAFILICIPRFIRDTFYDLVSKNRYRFFGKNDFCRIPSENQKHLFLS